jgi:hypothetical protein
VEKYGKERVKERTLYKRKGNFSLSIMKNDNVKAYWGVEV